MKKVPPQEVSESKRGRYPIHRGNPIINDAPILPYMRGINMQTKIIIIIIIIVVIITTKSEGDSWVYHIAWSIWGCSESISLQLNHRPWGATPSRRPNLVADDFTGDRVTERTYHGITLECLKGAIFFKELASISRSRRKKLSCCAMPRLSFFRCVPLVQYADYRGKGYHHVQGIEGIYTQPKRECSTKMGSGTTI